jgi:hypothetical protein
MGTPGVPPTSFPTAVDAPLVQSGTYQFNKADRGYIDSQILALQVYALMIGAGTTMFSYSQSCSAGGTIASGAASGIGIITLTGAPAAAFTYTLPTGKGLYIVVNNAGQYATITRGGNGIIVGGYAFVATDGTNIFGDAVNPNQRLTFATTGTAIVAQGLDTTVLIDQSGGQGTYPMPAGVVDKMKVTILDPVVAGGSWGTHPPILSVTGGTKIANSTAIATYSTTTTTVVAISGNSLTYTYGLAENAWFLS